MSRCIRCYACRDACPMCYCEECFVDHTTPRWIWSSINPSDVQMWHIVRAYHQTGRCVECGACERACPMEIPLLYLTKKLCKEVGELYGFEAGMGLEEPPLATFSPENDLRLSRLGPAAPTQRCGFARHHGQRRTSGQTRGSSLHACRVPFLPLDIMVRTQKEIEERLRIGDFFIRRILERGSDPEILLGKPVIKGTRLSVEFIPGLFAAGWTEKQILENYPTLTPESLREEALCTLPAEMA